MVEIGGLPILWHTLAIRLGNLTGNLKIVQEVCNDVNMSMAARYVT